MQYASHLSRVHGCLNHKDVTHKDGLAAVVIQGGKYAINKE